jgi:hypothetical protein
VPSGMAPLYVEAKGMNSTYTCCTWRAVTNTEYLLCFLSSSLSRSSLVLPEPLVILILNL